MARSRAQSSAATPPSIKISHFIALSRMRPAIRNSSAFWNISAASSSRAAPSGARRRRRPARAHLEIFQREHEQILHAIGALAGAGACGHAAASAQQPRALREDRRRKRKTGRGRATRETECRTSLSPARPATSARGCASCSRASIRASAGAICASPPISRPTKTSSWPILPTPRRSRTSSPASTASCISAATRSKAPGRPSSTPISSAATICSRRPTAPASSASSSPRPITPSAFIRAARRSAST